MPKDYYQILGVAKNASDEEIKKAYRKLAHQFHPDKQGGDEKKFKEVNEAYQVLSNGQKRAQYDQFGQTFDGSQAQGGFGGFDFSDFMRRSQGGGGSDFGEFDLGDIFGGMFGGGTRGRKATAHDRGQDIAIDIEISLEEAFNGVERTFDLKRQMRCDHCTGTGAEPGTPIKTCPTCKGSGYVREVRRMFLGTFATESVCAQCKGEGKIPEKACGQCRGQGRLPKTQRVTLHVPAGIKNGEVIKLTGEGESGLYGRHSGDLYATVHVKAHQNLSREGDDLHFALRISVIDAALGNDQIVIPTIDGKAKIKIAPGTDAGTVLRLHEKGMRRLHGKGRGDMFITIDVETPKRLSRKARELLEQLRKELE
ncbi:MAG: molecular chaperone DnaJ [bacterium]|nr:molecular chaperone DnaJ [bacterium]